MLEQRIQQQFFESADLQYQAAEVLAKPIVQAVQALEASLTAGGRVLVAGHGQAAGFAPMAVQLLVGRFERERPGLAALALGSDAALAAATEGGLATVLARQVQTLGQPGDVLLLIDPDGQSPAMLAAAAAAQAQDIGIVALTGSGPAATPGSPGGSALAAVLADTDVLVAVPHPRRARVVETLLLTLHCLCDAIDLQLMGELDSE